MPRPAYVILDGTTGVVTKTHSGDIASTTPTSNANDLEVLISAGFQQKREVALSTGKVLIILEHA